MFRDALESDYDVALPQALDFLDTLEPARPDLRDRLNQTILATARPQDEPRKAPPAQPAEPLEQQAQAGSQIKRRHAVHEPLRPDFSGGGGGGRLNLETIKRRMLGQAEQQATQPPPSQTTPALPAIPPQEPSLPEERITAHQVAEIKDQKGVRHLILIEKSKGESREEWHKKAHKKILNALDSILK